LSLGAPVIRNARRALPCSEALEKATSSANTKRFKQPEFPRRNIHEEERMSERDGVDVSRFVDAAARTISGAPFCWIATAGEGGAPRLRPLGRLSSEPGDDVWTLRFITDGRSGKAAAIRRAARVALVFQREADDAFVGLVGAARLEEREAEIRRRWKPAYDPYFPSEADKASAVFLTVDADRLDLWIRGVTPEPFGLKTTTVVRNREGRWLLKSDGG
jgi:general stress protein 26